jgi:hypothetical protein
MLARVDLAAILNLSAVKSVLKHLLQGGLCDPWPGRLI